jgi:CheY-like chemotaxis protein
MNSLQMIADDGQMKVGMRGDFDLLRDEFSLVMTDSGIQIAQASPGSMAEWLLTQLSMPVMDGLHFLSYLSAQGFDLPVLVSSSPCSSTGRNYLLAPTQTSLRSLPGGHAPGAQALCHGVTLVEFLRFCAEERQTRVLEVRAGGQTATFHLTFGKLIHAHCGGNEGLAAFLQVMSWKAPCLRILPRLPGLHTSMTISMEQLLLQATSIQRHIGAESAAPLPFGPDALLLPQKASPSQPASQRSAAMMARRWYSWATDALHSMSSWVEGSCRSAQWRVRSFASQTQHHRKLLAVVSRGGKAAGAESPAR